ncbi:MAG TPA: LamG domain-containing protein [Solirubrobacteraceae bacterium]
MGWCAAPASADPNVLAKWTLDEGVGQVAADSSGHANTGVLGAAGDPDAADPAWVLGHAGGSALNFNGSSYVSIPDTGGLEPAHLAVDAWVQHLGSPGRWRYVLSKGSLVCDRSAYGLYSGASGGMAFYVSSASQYTVSPEVSPAIVWNGAWHHVIGSYDGDRVRLWIDGSQIGTGTPMSAGISYTSGGRGVYIGTYRGSCELGFSGVIDDATVWDDRPAEATTGPVIDPVADTPTRIPFRSANRATAPGATAPQAKGCLRVSVSRHTIPIRRKTKLIATVRRGSRRVAGARLVISGKGVTTTGRRTTDRKGNTKISVRARKAGRLQVTVRGQSAGCSATTIRAR